jgi:hypothetical protein
LKRGPRDASSALRKPYAAWWTPSPTPRGTVRRPFGKSASPHDVMPDRDGHIVYAMPCGLMQAVAWFAGLAGVQPVCGGSHQGKGTTNFLVGLGTGAYLEIIGPDPNQSQPAGGRWSGSRPAHRSPYRHLGDPYRRHRRLSSGSEGSGLRSGPAHVHVPTDRRRRCPAVAAHATASRTQRRTRAVPDRLGQHPAPNKP